MAEDRNYHSPAGDPDPGHVMAVVLRDGRGSQLLFPVLERSRWRRGGGQSSGGWGSQLIGIGEDGCLEDDCRPPSAAAEAQRRALRRAAFTQDKSGLSEV